MVAALKLLGIPAIVLLDFWLAGYSGEVGAERLLLWVFLATILLAFVKPKKG